MFTIFRVSVSLGITLLLSACAASYGPKGIDGGYTDRPIDDTSFYLRYDGSKVVGPSLPHKDLLPLWERRAKELCGSNDYYKETKRAFFDTWGNETRHGIPMIHGVVYCNNRFIDSRRQNRDENFEQFTKLSTSAFVHKEASPYWNLLTQEKYVALTSTLEAAHDGTTAEEMAEALATFGRINPAAEDFMAKWIGTAPDSPLAYYSRSLYFHDYSWFKRGTAFGKDLSRAQREGLNKYRALALSDINKSLGLDPAFCPSYALKIEILVSAGEMADEYNTTLQRALQICPEYIGIYQAHLRYLLPRWHGSKKKMREFIDQSAALHPNLTILEALYIAEEGDQLLFSDKSEEAYEKYTEALNYGSFPAIYVQRGVALERLKRDVDALQDYVAAIRMSPYITEAYSGMVRILVKQGDPQGALIASSYLTSLNNQNPNSYETQGDIYYHIRRYNDALICYQKAAIQSANNPRHLHKIKMAQFQIDVRSGGEHNHAESST